MRHRSTLTILAGLLASSALAACSGSDPGDLDMSTNSDGTTEPQLTTDVSTAMKQAETVALGHLHDNARGLMNGVEAVQVKRVRFDDLGMAHTRVQQTLNGTPVFGGEAIIHTNEKGDFVRITDNFVRDIQVNTAVAITEFDATTAATDKVGGRNSLSEQPRVDLQVLRLPSGDYLAYRVQLWQMIDGQAPSMPVIFIDAHTGDELWSYDNLQTYSLSDSDKATFDMHTGTNYNQATLGDSSDGDLLTTHNSVGTALAFLLSSVGRDSFNDNGAVVNSYGHYSKNYVNAFWDGSKLTFGDGDNYYSTYLGVLDVAAHELGHGVTTYEANLTYSGESGALNEASSDILAAAVEAYDDGAVTSDTWDIGEDCWIEPGYPALRFMSHPSDDGSSRDHYSNRYTGSQDNGGVHWNSGIANHFFYLLSEGGQHHNPAYRTGNTVAGIGIDQAYKIWYRALTTYMTSSTNYAGARTATESACADLYNASTCASVGTAWDEVGVGSGGAPPPTGCPAGYSEVSGSLSGTGASDIYTYSLFNGSHNFILHGPSNADFDLYLYRNNALKASSTSPSSEEEIHYTGSANKVRVYSYSGSGAYTLCYLL